MNVLFLAHCVPFPPNKGEKIRAFEEIRAISAHHHVHLACFARDEADRADAQGLAPYCRSVHVEVLPKAASLMRGAAKFALGGCLNMAYFDYRAMHEYVGQLACNVAFDAAVAYTLPMCPYVPPGVPELFDMVDADSEKWEEYARMRRFGFLYGTESKRLRERELFHAARASAVYLTTGHETKIFGGAISPGRMRVMENGVDFAFFDPAAEYPRPEGLDSPYVVFVGTMDYFPNVDAACWFAREIYPHLRARHPGLDFVIAGHRPAAEVLQLARAAGVVVTGGVPDVRPYLAHAAAIVTPLRLARGIQNKVLEALSMGRRVLASSAVCLTFGADVPRGIEECGVADEFVAAVSREIAGTSGYDLAIRGAAAGRFSWQRNLEDLVGQISAIARIPVLR